GMGIESWEVPLLPHLFRFVPAKHSVSDVIRGCDGANLPRAVPGQAAGVAAIEDREKFRGVRKSAVVTQKIIVGDSAVPRPMKIVRHKAFIDVVNSLSGVVVR